VAAPLSQYISKRVHFKFLSSSGGIKASNDNAMLLKITLSSVQRSSINFIKSDPPANFFLAMVEHVPHIIFFFGDFLDAWFWVTDMKLVPWVAVPLGRIIIEGGSASIDPYRHGCCKGFVMHQILSNQMFLQARATPKSMFVFQVWAFSAHCSMNAEILYTYM